MALLLCAIIAIGMAMPFAACAQEPDQKKTCWRRSSATAFSRSAIASCWRGSRAMCSSGPQAERADQNMYKNKSELKDRYITG